MDKTSEAEDLLGVERTPSGRIRRTSAQVAVFHLQEIAEDELARDWTKRRMKDDLVPESARVSYLLEYTGRTVAVVIPWLLLRAPSLLVSQQGLPQPRTPCVSPVPFLLTWSEGPDSLSSRHMVSEQRGVLA